MSTLEGVNKVSGIINVIKEYKHLCFSSSAILWTFVLLNMENIPSSNHLKILLTLSFSPANEH